MADLQKSLDDYFEDKKKNPQEFKIISEKINVGILYNNRIAHFNGHKKLWGASVPKITIILALYQLQNHLVSLLPHGSSSISNYVDVFLKDYKNKAPVRSSYYFPKIEKLFKIEASAPVISDSSKTCISKLNKLDHAHKMMNFLGSYMIYSLKLAGIHSREFSLNQYYSYRGAKFRGYVVPGEGSNHINALGTIKVYKRMVSNLFIRQGLEYLKIGKYDSSCEGGRLDPNESNKKYVLYTKCGLTSTNTHDTWVYKGNHVLVLLSKLNKKDPLYSSILKDLHEIIIAQR
ncbi:hypothetical protein [Ekhidna sp. To15]|uniref:hypothetical protein n=1 Tax=Ekhidna sp. To15 TaxID=3395267 RepID=UPI003F51E6A2